MAISVAGPYSGPFYAPNPFPSTNQRKNTRPCISFRLTRLSMRWILIPSARESNIVLWSSLRNGIGDLRQGMKGFWKSGLERSRVLLLEGRKERLGGEPVVLQRERRR